MYVAPIEVTADDVRVGTEIRPKLFFHHEVKNVTGKGVDLLYEWESIPFTESERERHGTISRKVKRANRFRKLVGLTPKPLPVPTSLYFHDIYIYAGLVTTVWDA